MAKKYIWELTDEERKAAFDALRFYPHNDFDSTAPHIQQPYATKAYGGRFLTNCQVQNGEAYIRAYTCTGLRIFVSKFAYDTSGRLCNFMISLHRHHEAISDAQLNDSKYAKPWHEASDLFRKKYSWDVTNGTYDREKYERDFGNGNGAILTLNLQIVTGIITL